MNSRESVGSQAGFLMVDAIIALAILTLGFLFVGQAAGAQLARARSIHARVMAELTARNELAARWVQ